MEVVAIACNLTGNGLTLLVFTIYDVGRILRGGVHSTDVIKAASISKRHRRYNTACCSASTRQQTEQKQRKLALQLRGDNEGGMEERQHLLRPSQIAEEKEKTQQGAVLSSHAKKMARRTKTIVLQTGRALNEQRGKLAQAIVFYSVTWLCASVTVLAWIIFDMVCLAALRRLSAWSTVPADSLLFGRPPCGVLIPHRRRSDDTCCHLVGS
eukprot:SAG31_NODE_1310_length_8870_cov_2.332231_4_plen_211_part_00